MRAVGAPPVGEALAGKGARSACAVAVAGPLPAHQPPGVVLRQFTGRDSLEEKQQQQEEEALEGPQPYLGLGTPPPGEESLSRKKKVT